MTVPDLVEAARAMLLLGSLLAVFAVAAGVSEILDRFDPFADDDSAEDAA